MPSPLMRRSQQPGSMTGFALWDSLLLVALIASLLLATFIIQQSRTHLRTAQERAATALWADQQVAGFATAELRLPCPDTDGDGLENCEAGAVTGMLPVLTMGLKADAATRGAVQIKYTVARPAALDLGLLESFFEPKNWDGDEYAYGTSNGLDFCGKLHQTIDSDRNPVNGNDNPNALAYSVAVAQRDGDPDIVRNHTAADLANTLSCIIDMSSVNGIALAVDVVLEVIDENEGIREDAIITIAFNVLHIVLAGIDVALAAIGLAAAIVNLSASSAALAGAIASCIVLVGCAFIPIYTAAVVASVVAIVLFGVAIASGALAIAALVYSTVLAVEVAIASGNAAGNQTPSVDLAQQLATVVSLEASATQAEADAAAESAKLATALLNRNNSLSQIWVLRNSQDPSGTQDVLLNAAIASAVSYDNARMAQNAAQGAFDKATNTLNEINAAYIIAQNNCASATLPAEQYKCDAVPKVQQKIVLAQQDYATRQTNLTNANTQLSTAQTAYTTARNAVATAYAAIPPPPFSPSISTALDDYLAKYYTWQQVTLSNSTLQASALDSRAAAVSARAAYEQLKYNVEHPGTTPTGGAISVFGVEAILERADANGDVE